MKASLRYVVSILALFDINLPYQALFVALQLYAVPHKVRECRYCAYCLITAPYRHHSSFTVSWCTFAVVEAMTAFLIIMFTAGPIVLAMPTNFCQKTVTLVI
jgi:hypothetical protein